jgi:hypothetical protein
VYQIKGTPAKFVGIVHDPAERGRGDQSRDRGISGAVERVRPFEIK